MAKFVESKFCQMLVTNFVGKNAKKIDIKLVAYDDCSQNVSKDATIKFADINFENKLMPSLE